MKPAEKFRFFSSLADDVWHPSQISSSYEWWYFDAVSDDGRDALVIIFLDNFVFSPRYNKLNSKFQTPDSGSKIQTSDLSSEIQNPKSKIQNGERFPAVAFCFYRDGKPLYRAINEFSSERFSAGTDFPSCKIGDSEFQFEATPYGVRYLLNINVNLRGRRKLKASLEWLAVEYDCLPLSIGSETLSDAHFWNLVSPRSDVTGKIDIFDNQDRHLSQIQFRGTGYHDHNFDSRWLPTAVAEWQWGRAHFDDVTAVFYRFREASETNLMTKLFLIKDNNFSENNAVFSAAKQKRHFFGVPYPQNFKLLIDQNYSLTVNQSQIIDASFFYLRFLSVMEIDVGDGRARRTIGITEHLKPNNLRWRWLDWLVNMRIGRDNKGAFLP